MRRRTVKKKRSKSKRIMSQKYKKLSNVKFFMISYKGNSEFAKLTQRILKKEWGYSCKIYWGYQIDGDKYKRNNVLFEGVKDKMLPFMKKHNGPAYYIEDDIRFTEDPLNCHEAKIY